MIYGNLMNVSVGDLFLAGIIPGLLMGFALMAVICGEGPLYRVEVLTSRLGPRTGRIVGVAVPVIVLEFAVVLTREGWRVADLSAETTPFLHFPRSIACASMPVAGAITIGYALAGIGRALRGLRRS